MADLGIGGGNTPPPDLGVGLNTGVSNIETPPVDSPQVVKFVGDSITTSNGGQKQVSSFGYPGDPPPIQAAREFDFDQVTTDLKDVAQWLNVSYSIAYVNNMQACMDNVNQAQLTESINSMESSKLEFAKKIEKSEMTAEKAEAEAEKLMTSALISLCTSVSMAGVGLCTTAYSAKMGANAEKDKLTYDKFKSEYPNAGGDPAKSQADYLTKKADFDKQNKEYDDYTTKVQTGYKPSDLGPAPTRPNPNDVPLTPEAQTAALARLTGKDGSPKYIESQRQATVARAISDTITQNLSRTVPDAISNIYQAGMTVEIGAMDAAIIMMDAVAGQYERQMQNARTATDNLSQQISGLSQALNAVIDARKQNFSIRAN